MTFKFVKTEFHTGRLRFWYSPSGVPGVDDINYVYSSIIDLKYTNEVTFNVPYMHTDVYSPCRGSKVQNMFGLTVLNELRAPNTVDTSVSVIVEVSAGSDFEFASPMPGPSNSFHFLYGTNVAVLPSTVVPYTWKNISGQSGDHDFVSLQGNYEDNPVANAPRFEPTLDPSMLSQGERISSVKQMICRSSPLLFYDSAGTGIVTNLDGSGTNLSSDPRMVVGSQHPFMCIRDCYAFYRGSVRFKATYQVPAASTATYANVTISAFPNPLASYDSVSSTGVSPVNWFGAAVPKPVDQSAIEVQVPNYSMNPARRPWSSFLMASGVHIPDQRMVVLSNFTVASGYTTWVSAGDDFQLGLWITSPSFAASATIYPRYKGALVNAIN